MVWRTGIWQQCWGKNTSFSYHVTREMNEQVQGRIAYALHGGVVACSTRVICSSLLFHFRSFEGVCDTPLHLFDCILGLIGLGVGFIFAHLRAYAIRPYGVRGDFGHAWNGWSGWVYLF